jgi:hypothetical protein
MITIIFFIILTTWLYLLECNICLPEVWKIVQKEKKKNNMELKFVQLKLIEEGFLLVCTGNLNNS